MAADLESRLVDLYNSLGEFKSTDNASWGLASIFNALLEEVRKQHGDDPVVAAIQPAAESMMGGKSTSDTGTLRAATWQLRAVVAGD
jgi:hypothetical protein